VLRQKHYKLVYLWIRRVQVRPLTGQQEYQPLTNFIVSGFLFLARFLPGFGGILWEFAKAVSVVHI